jgi:membrane protein YdbS with pleckstrin-like domain
MEQMSAPANKLDPRVKTAWRIQTAVTAIPLTLIALVVAGVIAYVGSSGVVAVLIPVATIVSAIVWLGPVPEIRYRRWRWEVTELEVRLRHGLIIIENTVIPMVRIQHVDTSQGPIMRAFDLSDVKVSTAAGTHSIPALAEKDAAELRDKIAVLARVTDDGGL